MKAILEFSLTTLVWHALPLHAITVTNIAQGCTAVHSLILKSDGSLWGTGWNGAGQLGNGTTNTTNVVLRLEQIIAEGVTAIAAGGDHSLFLKSDSSLWAMGYNGYGQLGNGTYNAPDYFTNRPQQIVADGVTAIAAGTYHSLFLKADGSLWAVGDNHYGQLGDGTFGNPPYYSTNQPEQIVSGGVVAIAAGDRHSLFLKSDGSLWAMGYNLHGQLGDGTLNNTNWPAQILASGVSAIAAGGFHSLFLKSDGSLWAMGQNLHGQLGDGTFGNTNRPEQIVASGVTAIAAGYYHSLFLKSDGSLWGMGYNNLGQLGNATIDFRTNRPQQIVASGVTAIAAAKSHSLFLKSDGSLWGMGYNANGELGDGFDDIPPSSYGTTIPEQILPLMQPILSSALLSKTNLQFKATCGFGGNFRLLGSTNINVLPIQWTPLCTNSVTTRGTNNFSYTLTNAVNSRAQQFYILQSQSNNTSTPARFY